VIVDLTMLANLPVVDVPDQSPATARKAVTAQTPRSRKPPAKPAPKRKASKTLVPRPGHEAAEQEEAGEEDRG
jgi:hypothetical protein